MVAGKSCLNCPSYVPAEKTSEVLKKSIGVPVCAQFGTLLGTAKSTDTERKVIANWFASSCSEFGTAAPMPFSWNKAQLTIALPDMSIVGKPKVNPSLVSSCAGCQFFVREDIVADDFGVPTAACAAKGKLLLSNRYTFEARSCSEKSFGPVRNTTDGMTLLPEYERGFQGLMDPTRLAAAAMDKSDPTEYETDKPVSAEESESGIRAWRQIDDPMTGNVVFLPIYRREFFDEADQKLIPASGDDEHPEDYVDHNFYVYKVAVLWMELDETPAFWGQAGTGKGHPVSTKVLTPEGWRRVGDIRVGDEVIGKNGLATKVTGVYPRGVLPVNRVTMNDKSSVLVDDDHLWNVQTRKNEQFGSWQTVATRDLVKRGLKAASGDNKFRIPQVSPVEYAPRNLPLDPYVLGVLLANGSLGGEAVFSTNDTDVVNEVIARDIEVIERTPTPTRRLVMKSGVWKLLKQLNLNGRQSRQKFVPEEYLLGSIEDRKDLLAALLDCDGTCSGGHTRYSTMSDYLASAVLELVQSLGGTGTIQYSSRDDEKIVNISMPFNPFYTERKRKAWDSRRHNTPSRRIASIEPEGEAEVVCIQVAAEDQLYVTENFIVTHNTEFFRHMAYLMQVPFHRFSITGSTELDDLAGKMHYTEGTGTHFEYGRLVKAWMKPCVMVVDEPNAGPPDVWQFLRPMTDNSKQLVLDMNNGEHVKRHTDCYLGMAMNPAWDPLNVGTQPIGDADANRLMHLYVELPPPELEQQIILTRCLHDGWEIPAEKLKMVMGIAKDVRGLAENQTLAVTWGIRPQLKVARALRWFDAITAYKMASADYLEPEQQVLLLDVVKTHAGE